MLQGRIKTLEALDKLQWYHTRQIAWVNLQGYADPKKAPKDIETWWPLSSTPVKKKRIPRKKIQDALTKLNERLNG